MSRTVELQERQSSCTCLHRPSSCCSRRRMTEQGGKGSAPQGRSRARTPPYARSSTSSPAQYLQNFAVNPCSG